jgi:ribosomal protein L37AE/L43A
MIRTPKFQPICPNCGSFDISRRGKTSGWICKNCTIIFAIPGTKKQSNISEPNNVKKMKYRIVKLHSHVKTLKDGGVANV